MVALVVNKLNNFNQKSFTDYSNNQRGAGLLEILLSIGIMALISPFIYNQISKTARDIQDISTAKKITSSRPNALNFLRINQDKWPDVAQIKLNKEELYSITSLAHSGFIDKYYDSGELKTDIYLAFNVDDKIFHATKVAKKIGADAAASDKDHIAYGDYWAASAPDFKQGDVIYHIGHNFNSDDISKYLHRTTAGNDNLNSMKRDLNMDKFNIYNIGTISAESAKIPDCYAAFINTENMTAGNVYFSKGANIDGDDVNIKSIKINGDITGFREIYTQTLNDDTFSGSGNIITDAATINTAVHIGNDLTIKSDSSQTISGFTAMATHALYLSYLYTNELTFNNNFGITVSGELLQSTTAPLQLGSWYFPNTTPPSFSGLTLSRCDILEAPSSSEFDALINSGWKDE